MSSNRELPDLTELVLEHSAFVWRVLTHLGVPATEVPDASQEVFVIVMKRIESFRAESSLRTWLYGICRNVAQATRRKASVKREIPTEVLPEEILQPAQEGDLWIKRAHAQLVEALATLDDDQRTVFVLYEIEEVSIEEIAAAVGAKVSTCYARLYAAREKVQSLLRRKTLTAANAGSVRRSHTKGAT
jgi:RNA polymerase sigma-70 factor (ECF subfamily)